MCKNCNLFTIFTIFVLVALPAHFHISAAEHPLKDEDVFDYGNLQIRLIPTEQGEVKDEILLETENSPNAVLRYALKGTIEGEDLNKEKNQMYQEIPTELITRKLRKRSPAFAISVESVLQKLKKKEKIVLVDVRNREEFEKFRIPGSINIPLFAIKTKTFLKHKPLILINDGYYYSPLEREYKRLKDSGFTAIWILNGGLNAWREKGATVNGDIFAQKELNRMPPQVFFEEKNYENWVVIDVSKPKNQEALYLIPHTIAIPFIDNAGKFVSSIKRIIEKHEQTPFLCFLILNENGEQYERIEKLIEETKLRNVFYLKEGLMDYKRFLKQQTLMWQPKKYSRKTLKKCPSCP